MNSKLFYSFITIIASSVTLLSFQNCAEVNLTPEPQPAKSIDLKVESYCPSPGYSFSEVYAVNLSTYLDNDNIISDTDRDGLSDQYEKDSLNRNTYNISESNDDTSGNGYSDLVMVSLGYSNNSQQSLDYCNSPYQDSDRDLLDDCTEALIGTEINSPDSDKDGLPDGLEFRYGLNPRDSEDSKTDLDQDGLNSLLEVKMNTPIRNTNSAKASLQSTKYNVSQYTNQNGQNCYSIDINNITIADVNNGNQVKILFLETTIIPEQGEVSKIRDISAIISKNIIDRAHIVFKRVNNQTETFGFE